VNVAIPVHVITAAFYKQWTRIRTRPRIGTNNRHLTSFLVTANKGDMMTRPSDMHRRFTNLIHRVSLLPGSHISYIRAPVNQYLQGIPENLI